MLAIKTLTHTDLNTLFAAWSSAFNDYVRTWTKAQLETELYRRGYVPALSFGAFDGPDLVSFILNGTGTYNGIKTAYDTGTGTIPDYRGQRLVSKIFDASLPYLQQAGTQQYLLEVLQNNTTAVAIYTKAGFRITREFNYFVQSLGSIQLNTKSLLGGYHLQEIDFGKQAEMTAMHDFIPSWQNSFEALLRKPGDFKIIGAFANNTFVGYGIVEPQAGDIPQLAVSPGYRKQGVGSAILKELISVVTHHSIKIINTEISCSAITAFLENNGIPLRGKQFEMIKQLR